MIFEKKNGKAERCQTLEGGKHFNFYNGTYRHQKLQMGGFDVDSHNYLC